MTVYVESNFVLEQSLQQEECDSCEEIIDLASKGSIALVVPAFSLVEPHLAISGKEKVRTTLRSELRAHLLELGRSKPNRTVPESFEGLASILIASAELERENLRYTIADFLRTADVIALDAAILRSAAGVEIRHGLSPQDAIVLASVLAHPDLHRPTESCFLNRNSRDFDDPDILERLEALGCKLFTKFEDGHRYNRFSNRGRLGDAG